MFRRILVANRGEIAARVLRACEKLGIETIAVFSEADRDASYLENATGTVCIGPPRSSDSYLNMEAILQAALQTDCQAIHPGYGFLAENALFATRCALQKTTFIGPPPRAIALMGDKSEAKRTMRTLGLPTIPGSDGKLADAAHAARIAAEVGYPVLLKASAGGGGKGMRLARSETEIARAFAEAALEADKAFSDPSLYLEKRLEGARHIEFQILVDGAGRAVHLGERECSIQRGHQKLLEESPSPALREGERNHQGRRVAAALAAAGYVGAGTVEFLRGADGALFFMEVNARLQVEHPVTEMVTGIDLVEKQLRIAANEPLALTQEEICFEGHALELRINAEDPDDGFRPDPGTLTLWEPPTPHLSFETGGSAGASASDPRAGRGAATVRLDSHVRTGTTVPPFYDSLLGKLIVHTPSRAETLDAALRAAQEFEVRGVKTTLPMHLRILVSSSFRSGQYDLETLSGLLAGTTPERA